MKVFGYQVAIPNDEIELHVCKNKPLALEVKIKPRLSTFVYICNICDVLGPRKLSQNSKVQ